MAVSFRPTKEAAISDNQEATENQKPSFDGSALAEHARNLGAHVGKASESAVAFVIKAKEDYEGGRFRVMFGLQQDFTDEQLAEFAVPFSDTGNNPDEFSIPSENAKGKVTQKKTNFYKEFANGTPAGQALLSRIEMCERAGDAKAIKTDIDNDILEMANDPYKLEGHLSSLTAKLGNMPKCYKNAMELFFQFQAVNEYSDKISAEPVYAEGKAPSEISENDIPEVENTPKCIQVWEHAEPGKPVKRMRLLKIGEFLRLNPARATEKGGTFNALIESGAATRTPGSGANSDNGDGFVIKTVERGVEVIAEFHRWSTEILDAKDQGEYGKLLKLGNAKDNDEYIVAVKELKDFFTQLASDISANAKYAKLQKSGSELVKDATEKGSAAA